MSETASEALARIAGTMEDVATKRGRFNGCLYGPSDAGKSVLAAKILKKVLKPGEEILYVDTSAGTESLKNHRDEGLLENVRVVPFTTIEDIEVIIQAVKFKVGPFKNVKGLILDEGSSMAQIDIDRIYEHRLSTTTTEDLTPAWPDYHAALQRFRSMLSKAQAIPDLHIIICAHVNEKKDKQGNVLNLYPSFPDKIAKKVKEPMQMVGYLTAEYVRNLNDPDAEPVYTRMIQVHMTPLIDAKSRIGGLGVKVRDDVLINRIAQWAAEGGSEVEELPMQPTPEEPDPELQKMSTTEALEVAANAEDAVSEVDPDFAPVNVNGV